MARVVLWPRIDHQLVHDGEVSRIDEVPEVTGLPRALLVPPGQTLFRMKLIDAGVRSKSGQSELILRVFITEASMRQSVAVSQKRVELEWKQSLHVAK